MRITGGRLRGTLIAAPGGHAVRPTADRVRESLFNILAHGRVSVDLDGARILDAFSGTGALGLEAFSRGAAHVTFIDNARIAQQFLARNIAHCKAGDACDVLGADATNPPPAAGEPADIAFLDPPYGAGLLVPALAALARLGWIGERSLIVAEIGAAETFECPGFLAQLDARRHGAARIVFLSLAPQ